MQIDDQLAKTVLEFVRSPEYRPLKPRQIAVKLGLEGEVVEVRRTIKVLIRRGELAYGPRHLVLAGSGATSSKSRPKAETSVATASAPVATTEAPSPDSLQNKLAADRLTGIFRRTQQGHGYVRPSGLPVTADRSYDIYVSSESTHDAASGDMVLVQLRGMVQGRNRSQRAGRVLEVLQRQSSQFVGRYFEADARGYVQVDAGVFSDPIFVGDPGAKGAQTDDMVVIEMVRYPTHARQGEGVLVEVLGARGQPGVDTLSICREYNLPDAFPEDVLDEARQLTAQFDEAIGDRVDLTADTVITIDPLTARDFDDAISLTRMDNGGWRLGVHIADVSHFVPEKSALDREARARATSVYLPDRVIPMLPEQISNALASLQPDKVRYTKTCFIEFDAEGLPLHSEVHNTAIRSKRRFTYEEVDEFLADRSTWREKLAPEVFELLERMHELAMMLRRRRMTGGALELTMQQVEIDLNRDGQVIGAHREVNTESHQIIEEFMLAANMAVAQQLDRRGWHFLRRVHPSPDPRKLKQLTEFVRDMGLPVDSLESRFELQQLLSRVRGKPEEAAVNYAVLRSMARAVYSPEVDGHYALAAEHYCHFTSPIRRYPDLTIHRLCDALIGKEKVKQDFGAIVALGEHCSERERNAEAAERELIKIKLMHFLESKIGLKMHAVVTGVEEFGLFVQGVEIPAEGLVHISSLTDDRYRYDRRAHALVGFREDRQLRLGDPVTVEVVAVEFARRQLDFRLLHRGWGDLAAASPADEQPTQRPQRSDFRGPPRGPRTPAKKSGGSAYRGGSNKTRGKKRRRP